MAVKIIAEAGVNHNGDVNLAFELIDAAKAAGADAVKFQTFKASALVTADAQQCAYQVSNTGLEESQLAMLKRLELDFDAHFKLLAHCQSIGIEFLSTAFDPLSLNFLVNDIGLNTLKIASGEITNAPLLLQHAQTGCNLIVSTGMTTMAEVETALSVIAFGLLYKGKELPGLEAFRKAYESDFGQQLLQEKVTLLHCTTEYPASISDINLRAIDTMRKEFKLPVGYSDHSEGIVIAIAAVARDAVIIEKHFTLDKNMSGPDHKASLDPVEFASMVDAIRTIESALGDGVKAPSEIELENRRHVRKSLVCEREIKRGEKFTTENLSVKRPGNGICSSFYWQLLGKQASRDYQTGNLIEEQNQ